MKFLIDECLSPALRHIAIARGYYASTCVRDRGWAGTLDHDLMLKVLAEDFTLVTNNAVDFRGGGPGNLGGLHSTTEIHPGPVCLSAEDGLDLDTQRAMFSAALDVMEQKAIDLLNKALELYLLADGNVEYSMYDIPAPGVDGIHGVIAGSIHIQPYLEQAAKGS